MTKRNTSQRYYRTWTDLFITERLQNEKPQHLREELYAVAHVALVSFLTLIEPDLTAMQMKWWILGYAIWKSFCTIIGLISWLYTVCDCVQDGGWKQFDVETLTTNASSSRTNVCHSGVMERLSILTNLGLLVNQVFLIIYGKETACLWLKTAKKLQWFKGNMAFQPVW